MVNTIYLILFLMTLTLTVIYALMWHKNFDIHLSIVFALIPVSSFGYVLLANSKSLEAAIIANKIIYVGGCYLILFILLTVFNLCHIKISKKLFAGMLFFSSFIYLSVLSIGYYPFFYKNVDFEIVNGAGYLIKTYGPIHIWFYIMLIFYFAMMIAAIVWTYIKGKNISRKIVYFLAAPALFCVVSFFFGRMITKQIEIAPFSYVLSQISYLILIRQLSLYDINGTLSDSLMQDGTTGFISFDFKYRYLGANDVAKNVFPKLESLRVDSSIENKADFSSFTNWINSFKEDSSVNKFYYPKDDLIFQVSVNYLYDGNKKRGYEFFINDNTKEQKYISLLNKYNYNLQEEVVVKTNHILAMQENLILSMATLFDNKDNSSSGHIRRVKDVMEIFINSIKDNGIIKLSDSFCTNIVKAVVLHDLGKISVDDIDLSDSYTGEMSSEEKMKVHTTEGARIVNYVLQGADDRELLIISENVARYHHERVDGKGYPRGLKGDEIPLEAKLMAIVDVYDSLVSECVDKNFMTFEQAEKIMLEEMGTRFDKYLEPDFKKALPQIEEYYKNL